MGKNVNPQGRADFGAFQGFLHSTELDQSAPDTAGDHGAPTIPSTPLNTPAAPGATPAAPVPTGQS
ncbi:hypothetical protein OHB12_34200 [Nocardia sp. NBC_01730]|uniref:hypothetical protein n=1 Tax=Nocardia sp. NBC_01730 TaxID=2975998 RepID=UPI002E109C70|nr:hypothetical protein OHB12_34200 [Nocardia sp. NBC_01730]